MKKLRVVEKIEILFARSLLDKYIEEGHVKISSRWPTLKTTFREKRLESCMSRLRKGKKFLSLSSYLRNLLPDRLQILKYVFTFDIRMCKK